MRYTFDNYIVGDTNRLIYSVCQEVAIKPGVQEMNPLFIYGESGVGKTHLVKAIQHYVQEHNRNSNVVYIGADEFTHEFVSAIKKREQKLFKKKYRTSDLLILEDVQLLSERVATGDVFLKRVEELRNQGKQLIVTSDRAPQKLNCENVKFKGIMQWGLDFSDDIYEYIAQKLPDNPRILIGAINRLTFGIRSGAYECEGGLTRQIVDRELEYTIND